MMSVEDITSIIKEQDGRMLRLLSTERIQEREFPLPNKLLGLGAANIITGPRRCGKSVLSYMFAKTSGAGYLSFDDERIAISASELNKVLEAMHSLKKDSMFLVLDEIQEVSGWERFASRLVDEKKLIITGSNARMLSRELGTFMTGRHIDHVLLPFSFREFLSYNRVQYDAVAGAFTTSGRATLKTMLEKYLEVGGFPMAVRSGREPLVGIYGDMIERDVIQRYGITQQGTLRDFVRYLISNTAMEVSYSKLGNIFSMKDKNMAQEWLGYLESAYVLLKLERFSFKLKESVIAPKKVYAIDTGLANVVSLNSNITRNMENCVAIELFRRKSYWRTDTELNYWKDHQQHEVDFVTRRGRKVEQLIQVTYATDMAGMRDRETKGLVRASEELRCSNLLCITWDYEAKEKINGKTIVFMPLWKWLLERGGT
jgi:predicted AAA+ superfamily ATPase